MKMLTPYPYIGAAHNGKPLWAPHVERQARLGTD